MNKFILFGIVVFITFSCQEKSDALSTETKPFGATGHEWSNPSNYLPNNPNSIYIMTYGEDNGWLPKSIELTNNVTTVEGKEIREVLVSVYDVYFVNGKNNFRQTKYFPGSQNPIRNITINIFDIPYKKFPKINELPVYDQTAKEKWENFSNLSNGIKKDIVFLKKGNEKNWRYISNLETLNETETQTLKIINEILNAVSSITQKPNKFLDNFVNR